VSSIPTTIRDALIITSGDWLPIHCGDPEG
jgi:hypothetical protein